MRNLYALLLRSADQAAEKVFLEVPGLEDERIHYTYQDVRVRVNRWAKVLRQKYNIQATDRVAFMAPKCAEQAFLFYALWQIGAIAVPISETLGSDEVDFILRDAQAKTVFCDPSQIEQLSKLTTCQLFTELDSETVSDNTYIEDIYDHTACLIYTSGSTGRPKGVKLSHRNLIVNAISSGDILPINEHDRLASLLPYWHSFALTAEILLASYRQATLIFARDMREFSRCLADWKPTIIFVVPRMLAMYREMIVKGFQARGEKSILALQDCLETANHYFTSSGALNPDSVIRLKRDLHEKTLLTQIRLLMGGQLRFFVSGGAPLAPDLQDFFRNIHLPVYQGYGLTESSPVISCNTEGFSRTGSSGTMLSWLHPQFGGDWTFVNEDGQRGKNFEGELLVKGQCLMQGYWNHQDESAKALVDGWLHTGDMGYVDDGFLYLNGRVSNLICLQGGEKVHPEHIEDIIRELDSVSEVMVLGDGCKNIYALINKSDEAMSDELLRPQVFATIKSLAPFQRPKDLLFLPHFSPSDGTLTPTLKIRRKNIIAHYRESINTFLVANREKNLHD